MRCRADTNALLAQRFQLLFQLAQFADTAGDMSDVLIKQRVDLATLGLRRIFETQQQADLVQRHVQRGAMTAAALSVFGTSSGGPDLALAEVISVLAMTAARSVIQHARAELHPSLAHA